jgi:DNA-directed RNA polymerase subunit M/transcription elongation factor TFIIS
MEFCDDCGSMMKKDDGVWVCGSCGFEKASDAEREAAMVTTEGQDESEVVDVSEVDAERVRAYARESAAEGHPEIYLERKGGRTYLVAE